MKDGRDRGDVITLYKIVNGTEKLDNLNLVMMEEETRQMKGHSKEIKKESVFKGHKKAHLATWNKLKEEVAEVTNIHKFKEMLDIWRYGDRTL